MSQFDSLFQNALLTGARLGQQSIAQQAAQEEAAQRQALAEERQRLAEERLQQQLLEQQAEVQQQQQQQSAIERFTQESGLPPEVANLPAPERRIFLERALEQEDRRESINRLLEEHQNLSKKISENPDDKLVPTFRRRQRVLRDNILSLETGQSVSDLSSDDSSSLKGVLDIANIESRREEGFASVDQSIARGRELVGKADDIDPLTQILAQVTNSEVSAPDDSEKALVESRVTAQAMQELAGLNSILRQEVIEKRGFDPGDIIAQANARVAESGSPDTALDRARRIRDEAEKIFKEHLGEKDPQAGIPAPDDQIDTLLLQEATQSVMRKGLEPTEENIAREYRRLEKAFGDQ